MSDENQGGFKVTDRRLFNSDGSLRDDADISEPAPAPIVTPEPPAAVSAAAPAPPVPEPIPEPLDDDDVAHEQTMFTEFLMGIASSAFVYLGLVEHPATGRRQVDLMAAKESIDMLVMLREKTKGNLTRGEDRFFEDLLADLQMQFVALNRR
ncbi:MAG: DUF1844 domain-containing protein [Acidobacteriota bacterium]